MASDFKDRYGPWALITGATSGIGAELADQIAAKGVNIVLVARNEADLEKRANSIANKYGVETSIIPADLSTQKGVTSVKDVAHDIGLLVPAAGLEVNGAFEKTPYESELRVLQVNVIATFELTHHFSRRMVERGHGGILLVASLSGQMPNPYFANYAGSKSYVLNLGASLYGEFEPKGVDVTVLSPGLTATPMVADNGMDWNKTPMTAMEPSEVASLALDYLGKKPLVVPGFRNRLMVTMTKFSPFKIAIKMSEKMVRNAIDPKKL